MNETPAEKLDQLKAEIRTLGQELENIVSIESIAMRLILKNILDIANQLSEPTLGEKVEESFKLFIKIMNATSKGNPAFFDVFERLVHQKFDGLDKMNCKKIVSGISTQTGIQIDLVFDNDNL